MAVLITRPDERGEQLTKMLAEAGIFAIHAPMFEIQAGGDLNELPNKLNQLKSGDYVFAVSKSAVDFAAQTLEDTGFNWRKDLHFFAVGQRTAEHFACRTGAAVQFPTTQENSEGLLDLPEMQQLAGKRILILRGNGGRELFPEQAQARGAEIDIAECYRRQNIDYDNVEQTSIFIRAGIQTIVATSAEILTQLMEFVPAEQQDWLKNCRLITVSQRLADLAHALGWQDVIISAKADNQALLQTLIAHQS